MRADQAGHMDDHEIPQHARHVAGALGARGGEPSVDRGETDGPVARIDADTVAWAPRTIHSTHLISAESARRADALVVRRSEGRDELLSGVSGAVPVYVAADGGTARFATRLSSLTAQSPVQADWNAWADILAVGAPLGGKTTFQGIRRLQPWESVIADGGSVRFERARWPWLDIEPDESARIEDVADALTTEMRTLAADHRFISLLSGGWDSRILALYARHTAKVPPRAFTTSSDTGIVLEELIAAQAADRMELDHEIVVPRVDRFASDIRAFVDAVDHQTSYHVWLVPLLERIAGADGLVLDGLGGGLMLGGDFTAGEDRSSRIAGLMKYLDGADQVLRPEAVRGIRERTRGAFDEFDEAWPEVADHPFEATLTAYLNRTLPGISQSPYGLVAKDHPVATPFLADEVARAALRIPAAAHADGTLYPQLTALLDPQLATMPTAQSMVPWPRPHPRRITADESVDVLRRLVTEGPAAALLVDGLAEEGTAHWRRLLSRTGTQHLLRSLAMMNLWFDAYKDRVSGTGVEELMR
ncbi:Asparagine synthase [Brevibacterium sp. Mu109]|uniref:asparagine synthase-related protein n=1 Tax=Brevibacterium sp. Mu109 TaxID=1255669 RepID=UPI000C4425E7|nr:asparagine synthase-related protein [Brevibacterium sp. Mu109]SMX93971.1 Asparagine synthase [Brevibacterium sp. Mu109]